MQTERPAITVDKVDFSWDLDNGLMLVWGQPVVSLWIESTMAGFMVGLQRMVGTDRFNLAMEGAGRESTEAEWNEIIAPLPSLEEAFAFVGQCMRTVGLGELELLELDREGQRIRFRSKNSWEGMYQRALGVNWGTWSLAGKLVAYGERVLGTDCKIEQTAFTAAGADHDEFVVTPATESYAQRLAAIVDTEKATMQDLQTALARLRDEVRERQAIEGRLRDEIAERLRVEEELRGKLAVIDRQARAIHELSTPILQIWPGIVALPVVGPVDGDRMALMMESLLARISQTRARFVIIDLTGADALDQTAASDVLRIVRAARLLGAECLLSGISPRMSSTLVATGTQLHDVTAYGTLEAALRDAIGRLGAR